jgi:hypothetical protein
MSGFLSGDILRRNYAGMDCHSGVVIPDEKEGIGHPGTIFIRPIP